MKRVLNIAILLTGLAIFSQAIEPAQAAAAHAPTKAEVDAVVEKLRRTLRDPYSVRDAAISNVGHYDNGFGEAGEYVCVQFNAKNQYGAYVGLKTSLLTLNPDGTIGKPATLVSPRALCTGIPFRPLKEMDRLKAL